MKKAKLIILAVSTFSVLAGIFAFKAQSVKTYYVASALTSPCTMTFQTTATLINRNLGVIVAGIHLSSAATVAACPLTTLYKDTIQ
jgi:hypothetical protein